LGLNSEAVISIDYENKEAIICGSAYCGEIKKTVFSIMNYVLDSDLFNTPKNIKDDIPNFNNLKEWLYKLIIEIPNDIIKVETEGFVQDLVLYDITLDRLITTNPSIIDNKIGVTISIEKAAVDINGTYNSIFSGEKFFIGHISNLNVQLPFFLVRDPQTGLVSEVDTSGFTIDLDNAVIEVEIDLFLKDIIISILKAVLSAIKSSVIEKNIIETLNTKIGDLFQKANNIILNGIEPKELYIGIKEQDRSDLKHSPIISAVGYLLSNLTGANGPLSLNHIVNIFSYNTGVLRLHEFYDKSIHFEFNLTDKNNVSLGSYDIGLEDLNISGLNTWKNFKALEPYNKILWL